ncbi:MAG: beta-propeller fold lactonase family protein [Gemmatimonadaceae bacterium]
MQPRVAIAGALVAITACGQIDELPPTSPLSPGSASASRGSEPGAAFTLSNSPAGNAVLVFARSSHGALTSAGSYPTGGTGTGAGLGSQGAVTLSDDGRYLLAVNAGSNDVTAFRVHGGQLEKLNTVPSGGLMPISVTVQHGLAYVLNAGGAGGISGFTLDGSGLAPIAQSARPLSSGASGPAQISFTPNGGALVVTEKATNVISTYAVDADGRATGPSITPSVGQTPFGFAFGHNGVLIVSEAFGGAADASAASSYSTSGGSLSVLSASVPTTETAACWFAVTPNGNFAYTTNTGSGTVTGYRVTADGRLQSLDADGITGTTGKTPLDDAISRNGRFLYVLAAGAGAVNEFAIAADGSLTSLGSATGLPVGVIGLAVQ